MKPKEWWIELKSMCAWEINTQLPAHRPAVRVIEKSTYDALAAENEAYRKTIVETRNKASDRIQELRTTNAELVEALKAISKTKYGLEISDYNDLKYVSKYWADRAIQYEEIARKALAKHGDLK